ncbi:MAG TPA: preprotein translocase subunit SecA [bacterium]|nr:MAG: preprotein translocase subunit SecA [bacterium ADurb.Bin270]HPW45532.1 preprotein translocase subunit SecA [bacterium]HQC50828.1 preprotein translocase subunit SecA [bacterium]
MISYIVKKIFGTKNDRELKRIAPIVAHINSLEAGVKALSDDELKAKTAEFKARVANGEELDSILPEAFAVVREAGSRVLEMRHFDVQLIGGIVLNRGCIAEMKTGEGKTLVATLPVYLNALSGKGAHVVTVNDYLARRDSEWMGRLYKFLGLSVGVILHGLDDSERQSAYGCDITYGTNNEFGFDYLRDNMKFDSASFVQRPLNFCIVDEVDSVLIDEARTPLIISGQAEQSTQLYYVINGITPYLKRDTHFTVDEKSRSAVLTEDGVAEVESRLNVSNLYDPQNINILHHVNQALRAHSLYQRDVDYIVNDGQVVIVDEFTGRLMPGRRWSDGLHQAVEAKEGVRIENENQTLATITFQNFFRMYKKLSGMTGTADTEAEEFAKIYNLDVMVIPTHMPMVRKDHPDAIYKTEEAKFKATIEKIRELNEKGQPVLVGTISIEKSERLAKMLGRCGIAHHVLNAKKHDREAEIIAQAGRKGAVTISTNMAGRGTDILLGGNPEFMAKGRVGSDASQDDYSKVLTECKAICAAEKKEVLSSGGLFILGTERHESRRIDNQLRGRSGRQGDPGESCFFLSLEDDLLRIFGGDRISSMMDRIGMEEDEEIQHPWLSRAIANAQRKVEGHNFQIRKNLLEFDDVMNQQRSTVYGRRREILTGASNKDMVMDMIDQMVTEIVEECVPEGVDENFDPSFLEERIRESFNMQFNFADVPADKRNQEGLGRHIFDAVAAYYEERESKNGPELMRRIESIILLQTLDGLWKDNLLSMDHLKEGIGLRGYGQKDPLLEYKKEGFLLFRNMMNRFVSDSIQKLFRVQVTTEESVDKAAEQNRLRRQVHAHRVERSAFDANAAAPDESKGGFGRVQKTVKRDFPKVGRNDPCPCGSGKKYKKCCGA